MRVDVDDDNVNVDDDDGAMTMTMISDENNCDNTKRYGGGIVTSVARHIG